MSRRPPQLPEPLARVVSTLTEAVSQVTHRAPLMPYGQLQFMTAHHLPDAARAVSELGWTSTPLDHALTATIAYRNQSSAQSQYGRSPRHRHHSTSIPTS
jgi:hypothetical protein